MTYNVPISITLSKAAYEAVRKATAEATLELEQRGGLRVVVTASALIEGLIRRELGAHFPKGTK